MIDQYPSANGVLTSLIWRKTAAGGETSLSGYDNASQALSYTPGQEQVYLNGILLVRGSDYTATNGTSITGLAALAADDFVQINCYNNFSVASVPTTSLTGTIANNQLANSAITINGNAVSLGGSVSLAGDIESVTAGTGLSGGGNSGAVTLTNTVATTFDAAGDLVYGTGSDTFTKLSLGTAGQVLKVNSGATAPEWGAPAAVVPNNAFARVDTNQFTGSTTYTDLSTSGPSVTLTTGTKALVIITATLYAQNLLQQARMSYSVSGATTIAPSDTVNLAIRQTNSDTNQFIRASASSVVTLTAGSNTFTAKYRWDGGGEIQQAHFADREIFVMNLA